MASDRNHLLQERIESIQNKIQWQLRDSTNPKYTNENGSQTAVEDLLEKELVGTSLNLTDLASMIEHTLLKAEAKPSQIQELCAQAIRYQFATACVNPRFADLAASLLHGTAVRVCCVIGFPLGATKTSVKSTEAVRAIEDGASEIDMVLPIGVLREEHYREVFHDIQQVAKVCQDQGSLLKVIIEASELTEEEKIAACLLSKEAGAQFVKTSTGFGTGGATKEDVALMRAVVGDALGVKASGGIRNLADALTMVEAGADRLGTSSGVHIIHQAIGDRLEPEIAMDY